MPRSILLDHLLQQAWGYSMGLLLRVGIKSVVMERRRGDVDVTLAPTVRQRTTLWDFSHCRHFWVLKRMVVNGTYRMCIS